MQAYNSCYSAGEVLAPTMRLCLGFVGFINGFKLLMLSHCFFRKGFLQNVLNTNASFLGEDVFIHSKVFSALQGAPDCKLLFQ